MIKFFRRIRQNLLSEGKTGKYLKYAIGEIILVVIGILIAVQINNWNENQRLKTQELKILLDFRESLDADAIYRSSSTKVYNKARKSMDFLIAYIESHLPYTDSLKYHFGNIAIDWGLSYDFSTYEALKSKDLNLISNAELRSDIISYYRYAENLATNFTNRYSENLDNASRTIFSKHFNQMWTSRIENHQSEMIPNDYGQLEKDEAFMYFLKTLKNQNYWFIENVTNNSNDLYQNISKQIESEIKNLK